jgi:hypothetical protein
MSNPLDELKELEAKRPVNGAYQGSFDEKFGREYRRLALEFAEKFEAMSRVFDIQLPIIFSPSDPRVVVGQTYDFCNVYDFNKLRHQRRGVLRAVYKGSAIPFEIDTGDSSEDYFVFLRELPKEERG